MDASFYTEPIKTRQGRGPKPAKTHQEKRSEKHQAKLDAESIKAKDRLGPILFRKEKGTLKIQLSQASLDRLAHTPGVMPAEERRKELWSLLCLHLDQHGFVNHRVVKDEATRLEMISKLLDQELEIGVLEKITRVSSLTVSLSDATMREQKFAHSAHNKRLAQQRQPKEAAA